MNIRPHIQAAGSAFAGEIDARWPRGLRREDAASYVGVSPCKFDDWVKRGVMPKPKRIDRVVVWDRLSLDSAFAALPDTPDEEDTWADL